MNLEPDNIEPDDQGESKAPRNLDSLDSMDAGNLDPSVHSISPIELDGPVDAGVPLNSSGASNSAEAISSIGPDSMGPDSTAPALSGLGETKDGDLGVKVAGSGSSSNGGNSSGSGNLQAASNRRSGKAGKAGRVEPESGNPFGGLFWFLTFVLLLAAIWKIGPRVVEDYHYAATLGKIRAEYKHSGELLKDSSLSDVSEAYQLVAQRVRPSVVSIRTFSRNNNPGLGSGVIISDEGYIVTNAHVISDSDRFFVELYDKRQFRATKVGMDDHSDLAVIKIEADDLIAAQWGDSEMLSVGSMVWAVGSPFEYEQTVTSGIISGKNRSDGDDLQEPNMLQTDAAISPGSSGGPLVDAQGHVVGINTSIYGKTFQGISFAVPSQTAEFVIGQLIRSGKVSRGYLGVTPGELNQLIAKDLNLPDLDGALLKSVQYGSPAHISGLKTQDVIRSWNGKPIKEFKTLYREVEVTPPNTTVNVTVFRGGIEQQFEVTVKERVLPTQRPRAIGSDK